MKCPRRLCLKRQTEKKSHCNDQNTMALLNTKLLIDVYNKALNSIQYKTIMNTKQDNKMILFTFLFLYL